MRSFFMVVVAAALVVPTFVLSSTPGSQCVAMNDSKARLACYDAALGRKPDARSKDTPSKGDWHTTVSKSKFDDRDDVFLRVQSKGRVVCSQHGVSVRLYLQVRCLENTTAIFFSGACYLASGHHGYGSVDLRIDDNSAFERQFDVSTNSESLGLWSGSNSIPLIKRMLGGETLLIRFAPFNMSPVTAEFNIRGLEEAIKPLRKQCGW